MECKAVSLSREVSKCNTKNTSSALCQFLLVVTGLSSCCLPSQAGELSGDAGDAVAPQAPDDTSPWVLGHDTCRTEVTKKNRKYTAQQLGQTNSTSTCCWFTHSSLTLDPSPCKNLPARGEINQSGEREGVIHGRFYILSVNAFV